VFIYFFLKIKLKKKFFFFFNKQIKQIIKIFYQSNHIQTFFFFISIFRKEKGFFIFFIFYFYFFYFLFNFFFFFETNFINFMYKNKLNNINI